MFNQCVLKKEEEKREKDNMGKKQFKRVKKTISAFKTKRIEVIFFFFFYQGLDRPHGNLVLKANLLVMHFYTIFWRLGNYNVGPDLGLKCQAVTLPLISSTLQFLLVRFHSNLIEL